MPTFSIIIPTTRAHYLEYSLKSALNQDFNDFEVVVIDNQSDGADKIVNEISDPRVKYVRTPEKLAMSYNWEFGLKYASGEYITYLGDDDVFVPQLLSTVNNAISNYPKANVFNWTWGGYISPSFPIPDFRNKLSWSSSSEKLTLVKSSKVLRDFYNPKDVNSYSQRKRLLPSIFHACCHRHIVEAAQKKGGKFFFPSCPDFSSGIVALAFCEEEILIDKPLVIYGVTIDSCGVCMVGERSAVDVFYEEYKDEIYQHTPLKTRQIVHNTVADTMLITQAVFPEELGKYEFGLASYFKGCYREILIQERNGLDLTSDREEFEEILSQQSSDIQCSVREWIRVQNHQNVERIPFTRSIGQSIQKRVPIIRNIRRTIQTLFEDNSITPAGVVNAQEKGLRDILECAEYVGKIIRKTNH
ncbi:glycosyltransferase family 2 protein [Thermodesulfobacteriota bacterium]